MQGHAAAFLLGNGNLGVAAPGQGRQPGFDLLVGGFVAAAAHGAAAAAVAVHHHHAVAALLIFGVGELLPVGAEHGLRVHGVAAIGAAEAGLVSGQTQGGGGRSRVQVPVVGQPLAQKHLVGHVQRGADADFHVAGDAGQVEDVLDGGVAVALGHVVPDALAGEAVVAHEEGCRAVAGRMLPAHVAHVAVHVHAPALGGVGGGPTDEPVGQLQQVGALQHFLERAAVHHIIEQHLRYLLAHFALEVGLLASEGNLHLRQARERGLAANLLAVGVEADVALPQVAHGVVEHERGLRVGIIANQARDALQLGFGIFGGAAGAARALVVIIDGEVLGAELLPPELPVLNAHPPERLLRRLGAGRKLQQPGRQQHRHPHRQEKTKLHTQEVRSGKGYIRID